MGLVAAIFSSVTAFAEKFEISTDPNKVIIDFKESHVVDMSTIESIKCHNKSLS